ncbi:MAG: hypothetical protein GC204_02085 [Chloroflexi bacterium]|nr:hypothetical protein [Chloroflexota bacterium]
MNLETVSSKHLNELERLLREVQLVMRKAGLHNEPIAKSFYELEVEVGQVRRARFDAANPEYTGY